MFFLKDVLIAFGLLHLLILGINISIVTKTIANILSEITQKAEIHSEIATIFTILSLNVTYPTTENTMANLEKNKNKTKKQDSSCHATHKSQLQVNVSSKMQKIKCGAIDSVDNILGVALRCARGHLSNCMHANTLCHMDILSKVNPESDTIHRY